MGWNRLSGLGLWFILGVVIGLMLRHWLMTPRASAADSPPVAVTPGVDPAKLMTWGIPEKGGQTLLVVRVVDGDTVDVAMLSPVRVRVSGIDAPEVSTEAGRKAREYARTLLVPGQLYAADLHGRDKYGRLLANLLLGQDRGWFAEDMIRAGHARSYDGGKREAVGPEKR